MLITTTSVIEGAKITRYYGIVSGETIIGANVFRDAAVRTRKCFVRLKIRRFARCRNKPVCWALMQ